MSETQQSARRVLPGTIWPMGATWDGDGVNFALYSERATGVDLCLFDGNGAGEERIPLREVTAHVWHAYLPGVKPGQLYGYRVHGPYEPKAGLRFNPNKLLLDPYARAITGRLDWSEPVFGYTPGHQEADLSFDERDDAAAVPKGIVIDPHFAWEGDAPQRIPWTRTVIYEAHVKGFTMRHPDMPENLRGSYAGLASPPMIDYLKRLGVTAVELLPIHEFIDESFVVQKGLVNYWGYNTIGFFAPTSRYSSGGDRGQQVTEFKEMVKTLHQAGIEVILDVVYNHTAEGDELGPTLSFRGIANQAYYRLDPRNPRHCIDYTGTGNSLNMQHPQSLRLIMDSLRYWITEMHIDGFRFDLAATLARELHDVDRLSAFFDIINQDPVISQVKLIAEPWDVGEGGYQVGNFPVLWTEWNGKYRDAIRRFWRGDDGLMAEIGFRLTGSSDLYQDDGRKPYASINFIVAHDGFTLNDLVSYNDKHNEANGEQNRDGANDNNSWNQGHEGPTDDSKIVALRERQKRNLLATLFFSQGAPMLCGGDEIGRTQQGNNNAYCQDNEISWFDWELDERRQRLLDFTRRLIEVRYQHPLLRRYKFFQGREIHGSAMKDLTWLRPDGHEMTSGDWNHPLDSAIALRLNGEAIDEIDENGERVIDDTLLLILNADATSLDFVLPEAHGGDWAVVIDTNDPALPIDARTLGEGKRLPVGAHSLLLLRQRRPEQRA